MKIELKHIAVRDLCAGYEDNADAGVVGYDATNLAKRFAVDRIEDAVKEGLPVKADGLFEHRGSFKFV